jgi:hypothetical protein
MKKLKSLFKIVLVFAVLVFLSQCSRDKIVEKIPSIQKRTTCSTSVTFASRTTADDNLVALAKSWAYIECNLWIRVYVGIS